MRTCAGVLTGIVWIVAAVLFLGVALFCARHQRLPMGSGEVINWMLGLTA